MEKLSIFLCVVASGQTEDFPGGIGIVRGTTNVCLEHGGDSKRERESLPEGEVLFFVLPHVQIFFLEQLVLTDRLWTNVS